nr:hypothetical protein [Mucilaginibacter sp. SP1R1]
MPVLDNLARSNLPVDDTRAMPPVVTLLKNTVLGNRAGFSLQALVVTLNMGYFPAGLR